MKPEWTIDLWEQAVFENATYGLELLSDGAWDSQAVETRLAPYLEVDVAATQRAWAKRLILDLSRSNTTKPNGQLELDLDARAYEPLRLIKSADGSRITENSRATIEYKLADEQRAAANRARCERQEGRKRNERIHMEKWIAREAAKGRPALELTWGNCVKETGIWSPKIAEPERDDDDDD